MWRSPRPAASRRPGRRSARCPAAAESRRTAPAGGADPCTPRLRTGPKRRATRLAQAITGKSPRDQRVVVRPDRAIVVRHRIVARLGGASVRMPQPEKKPARAVVRDPRRPARALRCPRAAPDRHWRRVRGTAACRRRAPAHRCRDHRTRTRPRTAAAEVRPARPDRRFGTDRRAPARGAAVARLAAYT